MSFDGATLYSLLPALYRIRDAQLVQGQSALNSIEAAQLQSLQASPSPLTQDQQVQLNRLTAKAGGPLLSLLSLVGEQLAVVENDLDQLYDNLFIETCADWVIPYIGDLIGYQAVNGVAQAVASPRAEVANTISLRRRKGTVLVLEQLARDVTGWGAHAVEFFKRLGVTQYMNHVRPNSHYAPDLRRWRPRGYMDTGFDDTAHTVEVRRIAVGRGRYNIQNVGIFLWSLNSYSLTSSPAVAVAGNPLCFRLSPLGCDMPLFNDPAPQPADITAPAQPVNVPDRLRRHVLCCDIEAVLSGLPAAYYGAGLSLALYLNGALLTPAQIQVCDLSGPDATWTGLPLPASAYAAAIDPALGRVKLYASATLPAQPTVSASFHYGFFADMGGGEYPRAATFTAAAEQQVIAVSGDPAGIQAALDALGGDGVVEIADSGRYAIAGGLSVAVAAGGHIELRGRDGSRPTFVIDGEISVTGGDSSEFDMNGLLVVSTAAPAAKGPVALVHAPAADSGGKPNGLASLNIVHCTLTPGWALTPEGGPAEAGAPGVVAEPPGLALQVTRSVVGGIRAGPLTTVSATDSVIDANGATAIAYAALDGASGGGALTLQGCTVVGKVHATLLSLVSDSIVWAQLAVGDPWQSALWADRKQTGCVRFSYLPQNPILPRKYECVIEAAGTPGPLFASLRYGDPEYAKLVPATDHRIRRGADDGGEMGAFHFVLAPQRETDLLVRLGEYLPVGLECGVIYQT